MAVTYSFSLSPTNERVGAPLVADGGGWAMTRDHPRRPVESVELLTNRLLNRSGVATSKIGAADRSHEQSIAGEQEWSTGAFGAEAAAARRMTGRVHHVERASAEAQRLAIREPM